MAAHGGEGGRQYLRDHRGHAVIAGLLDRRGYDRELAHMFLDHAHNPEMDWASRRVAVLGLEHQLLMLDAESIDEFVPFLVRLGFMLHPGGPCRTDALKQGYTTLEPRAFVAELIRRLSRLAPVHDMLQRVDAAPEAITYFEHVASQECLLTLARSAFTPEEVVARVLRHVRLTIAKIDTAGDDPIFREEAKRAADRLPEYEADILARLTGIVRSWWVGPETPSTLNALVEYPVGTVALVIRPPGSTTEFEIKRVGLRGSHPLSVLFERRGEQVPPSHRLQGATTLSILRWEAANSALLSSLFRGIHGESAPISQVGQLRSIQAVPRSDGRAVPLQAWFGDPGIYGDGYARMRRAMTHSLHSLSEETDQLASVPRLPDARTRAFLQCMTPGQCTIVATSALRLDKVSAWLRDGGPKSYFRKVHGRTPSRPEARRFVDTVLMEILGNYRPPPATGPLASYIAAAFAIPDNRCAADRAFRSAAASMGRLWGTLLGLRGYAEGESFVPRNVGLKAVWAGGAWRVQIVFMDHELTNIIGKRTRFFHPRSALPGMDKDLIHILGGKLGGRLWPGSLAVLAEIYGVDAATRAKGRESVIDEMRGAYHVTLRRLRVDAGVRSHFRRSFLDPLLAWDAVVGLYRSSRVGARQRSQWKGRMRRVMEAHGLEMPLIKEYRRAIRRHGRFLRRCPYLFDADDGA
jgi:hypothetical protein